MSGAAVGLEAQIADATARMTGWLRALPEWPSHPVNATGSESAHFGPTILSEHDCVMHFARFLNQTGVAWEHMHLELSPGQWMYGTVGARPKRIDLAVVAPGRLAAAGLPVPAGGLPLDAVFEFALASNYWKFGGGSARALRAKVDRTSRRSPSTSAAAWPCAGTSWSSRNATTTSRTRTRPTPLPQASRSCC